MPKPRVELDLTELKAMPKVDLHRHLEGCIRLQTIIDLARDSGVELPAGTPEELAPFAQIHEPLASLEEALTKFAIAQNSFRSYEAVRRIAREAVEDLAAEFDARAGIVEGRALTELAERLLDSIRGFRHLYQFTDFFLADQQRHRLPPEVPPG